MKTLKDLSRSPAEWAQSGWPLAQGFLDNDIGENQVQNPIFLQLQEALPRQVDGMALGEGVINGTYDVIEICDPGFINLIGRVMVGSSCARTPVANPKASRRQPAKRINFSEWTWFFMVPSSRID